MATCPFCGFRVRKGSGNKRKVKGTSTWAHKRKRCPEKPKVYVDGPRHPIPPKPTTQPYYPTVLL
jgi:hypothetical protein